MTAAFRSWSILTRRRRSMLFQLRCFVRSFGRGLWSWTWQLQPPSHISTWILDVTNTEMWVVCDSRLPLVCISLSSGCLLLTMCTEQSGDMSMGNVFALCQTNACACTVNYLYRVNDRHTCGSQDALWGFLCCRVVLRTLRTSQTVSLPLVKICGWRQGRGAM